MLLLLQEIFDFHCVDIFISGGQGRYPTGGGYGGNGGGGYGGNAMVAGGGGYGGNAMVAGGYGQAPAYRANNTPIARNEAAPKVDCSSVRDIPCILMYAVTVM